jgi:hypothetical protein
MPTGNYKLWAVDRDSKLIDWPAGDTSRDKLTPPDPSRPEAIDIYFGVRGDLPSPPPKEQLDLVDGLQRVLRAIRVLYLRPDPRANSPVRPKVKQADPEHAHPHPTDSHTGLENTHPAQRNVRKCQADLHARNQFRGYYVRLYRAAQLGLEGDNVSPDISLAALSTITSDLIDDEGGHVKNRHLRDLGVHALCLSAPCLIAYVVLCLIAGYWPSGTAFLRKIHIDPVLLSSFSILLVGCFLGVWLSYGIRTTKLSLSDLTVTDSDRLTPLVRLLFAGALTMIVGIILALDLVQVKFGTYPVTNLTSDPMFAFLVGCLCGVSELVLPTQVANRANELFKGMK